MFREKTILRSRKDGKYWNVKKGKNMLSYRIGISRLFRLVCTLLQDKGKIYDITFIVKRRR